jgi:hypothetical protein
MSNRRSKPKRIFRERRQLDYGRQFQTEMLREHVKELASGDGQCVACERQPAPNLCVWTVNDRFARHIQAPAGRKYLYRLCDGCAGRARDNEEWIISFIEAAVIARARGEHMVAIGADGMPVIEAGPTPLRSGLVF